jgi:hypothetical protein
MIATRLVRFGVVGAVVVALLLVFLAIKIVPASSGGKIAGGFSDAPFGPFAGYTWIGSVHSVGVSFTVPQIAGGSALSEASTWIGAQGQGPPARFVQIGEIEARFFSHQKQKTVDGYFTFWSDTAHHFEPQLLFGVSPEDTLSASLMLANKYWRIAITDNSSGKKARFSIADETDAPFDQAEWTQEDPGNPNNHARYPQMTAPVFRHVTVNSTAPAPVYSQWMSVNHSNLAPTVVHDDSFTLQPAPAVSAAASQYMRLTTPVRAEDQRFDTERKSWTPKTPYPQIANASLQLIEATQRASRAMLSAQWSKQIGGLVRAATNAGAAFLEQVRPPTVLTEATFVAWNSALTEASQRTARVNSRLRLALGLPGFGIAVEHR